MKIINKTKKNINEKNDKTIKIKDFFSLIKFNKNLEKRREMGEGSGEKGEGKGDATLGFYYLKDF